MGSYHARFLGEGSRKALALPGRQTKSELSKMISIQKATLDDAPEIWRIQKVAFEGQAKIYDNHELPPLLQTLDSLKSEFEQKTFLKAVLQGKIIGSVRFTVEGDEIEIERLIVDPMFQNQGFGTMLMKRVEEIVDENKILKLFTGVKSLRNIHVYEKLGYETYARSETPHGVRVLHMKKMR
jgi:ribosomal protein S18 acetylase RimI-like enzyme